MTSSAVFGDITGVLKETKEGNSTSSTDILNELHYKQFAVSWNKHDYELDPKSCIEDIFLGGTGFKKSDQTATARRGSSEGVTIVSNKKSNQGLSSSRSDLAPTTVVAATASHSNESIETCSGGDRTNNSSVGDVNRLHMPPYHMGFGDEIRTLNPSARLLSEEEEREDLRSWKLREVY